MTAGMFLVPRGTEVLFALSFQHSNAQHFCALCVFTLCPLCLSPFPASVPRGTDNFLCRFYNKSMIIKSFFELFVAGCLEVRYEGGPGMSGRLYRVIDELDLSLLSQTEQMVARFFSTFRSFASLLEETGCEIHEAREELMEQCADIIDDTLQYCPPVTSCSV